MDTLSPGMRSFAAEFVADSSGKFAGNQLRFATHAEAKMYAADLESRWMLVTDKRIVQSPDEPNYQIVDGVMGRIPNMRFVPQTV